MNEPQSTMHPDVWKAWLVQRLERWRTLSALARGNRADQDLADARIVLSGFREVAREVALARRVAPGTLQHRALEALHGDLHRAINRPAARLFSDAIALFVRGVPNAVRKLRREIIVVVSLFVASAGAGALLVTGYPDTAGAFLSSDMIETVQRGQLWTDNILNVVPSSMLSVNLMTNNITVALTCVALGLIYGLGTLYIICLNGMMLGGVFAYTHRFGLADELYRFVVAHGIVELSVICLAGAAGLAIGRAIARPGADGRMASARAATRDAGALAAVSIPFLIGSGIIEAYVSPEPQIATSTRTLIGLGWFMLLLLMLDGRVWRGRSAPSAHAAGAS